MSNLFKDSESIFLNIINKYDIILDDNYNNLKELYYLNNFESDFQYKYYFNLFNKYYYLKEDINLIYYIIILYYISKEQLLNYIRFFTSKLYNYNLLTDNTQIKQYSKLINFNKIELIQYLETIINNNEKTFLFFILSFQYYF